MANIISLKARRILGYYFNIVEKTNSAKVNRQEISIHYPVLKTKSKSGFSQAMDAMRQQKWVFKSFKVTIEGDLLLDTSLGWTIAGRDIIADANRSILEQSNNIFKPNIMKWIRAKLYSKKYGEVVWMPYGSGNYWHFINDLIGGICLIKDDINNLPVLVEKGLFESSFFKEIVEFSSYLSKINWVTYSDGEWVSCKTLRTSKALFGSYSNMLAVRSILDRRPLYYQQPSDMIFISRRLGENRGVNNDLELNELMEGLGFKIVLFEEMSVSDQWKTINSANRIVSLHGAGMINIAFHERPKELKLLEITSIDYINPCFAYEAEEAGISYYCLDGGPMKGGKFSVNINYIRKYIELYMLDID